MKSLLRLLFLFMLYNVLPTTANAQRPAAVMPHPARVAASETTLKLKKAAAPEDNRLWYKQPAVKWTDAMPLGNGRLGAMVFGGTDADRIQFNEETLWTGTPRDYNHPGAAAYLPEIRRLLAENKQAEAEKLADEKFMGLQSPAGNRKIWVDAMLALKGMDGNPALPEYDDTKWKTIHVPSFDGWEAAGLEGLDGAVWFRTTFELPAALIGQDMVLDLNKIRDQDFTYINGKLAGTTDGNTASRKYVIPASMLKPGTNVLSVQVLNFFDKGGIAGYKDTSNFISIHPATGNTGQKIHFSKKWKYRIQDQEPPAVPHFQADYQPFGDLRLDFAAQGKVSTGIKNYRRELNLSNAVSTTTYTQNGITYTRTYFVSEPDQVIVVHLSANKPGSISFRASLSSPHQHKRIRKVDGNTIGMSVKVRDGALKGDSYLQAVLKKGSLTFSNPNEAESKRKNTANDNVQMYISNADEVTLYLTAGTNFVNYKDVSGNPEQICKKTIRALKGKTYAAVKKAHVKEYQQYYKSFSIDLGHNANQLLPTDIRLSRFSFAKDPAFAALYLQYGRYLLISGSRPGTQPANLQGIWNDLLSPPWGSKYTTNINAEMNYWPAEVLNLSPMHEPMFNMITELSVTGAETAKVHYNAPGWVVHHNTDIWRGTAPINSATHGIWVTGAAWLSMDLWEHFLFTQDKVFLAVRAYPLMKSAAQFFISFLQQDPKTGWLISTPSNSPENGGLVAGPSMDHQIIRTLFKNCIAAAEVLHTDTAFSKILQEKYKQIAPGQIGRYGQLQEWLEDKDDPKNKHRHVSHLWGVHPGNDMTWDQNPELMKAARQSLIYRGDEGTGWSLAWKINFWARFKEGDHAMKMLKMLISPVETGGGAYLNLFDAHPPFQIDGNFGGAAGIAEMLIQSHTQYIDLLPALPEDFPYGEVKGICARGGFVLNLKWNNHVLQQVEILSKAGKDCLLRYKGKVVSISTRAGQRYSFNGQLNEIRTAGTEGRSARIVIPMNENWKSVAADKNIHAYDGFEQPAYNDQQWKKVSVPHSWDKYEGYRRLLAGNRHGYAWYRKTFRTNIRPAGKRFFLYFEGVGSYATVFLNGKLVGKHAGGRTTFTLDVTNAILLNNKPNVLSVRADHPAGIQDLPWVDGGSSPERGFSEGSQPMGIFRPLQLIVTDEVRIEPFGVHIWNDTSVSTGSAALKMTTELKNYGKSTRQITLYTKMLDSTGKKVGSAKNTVKLNPGTTILVPQEIIMDKPTLWSPSHPYLYTIRTSVYSGDISNSDDDHATDELATPYGIRSISWPIGESRDNKRFLINGQPFFINGIAEYEHLIGNSHAFTSEQIYSRVMQIKAAGFNAFRDAHQPHNLRYLKYWDKLGILCWTQMAAHVWYDTPVFRQNFKTLLKEWVKERRNSPSIVLWGLENESTLPEDFAKECTEIIREMDPTASAQRKVTTCNGGKGTDWDVPQNWTGTYGGDPLDYGKDLERQVLIGEYGAWRTLDMHTEGPFVQNGAYSEDRMAQLMETKIRLADKARDKTAGHFFWLFNSHDNPGRVQGGEGLRELDRVGPVNYKGLLTPWEEPLDVYYLYRANYAPKQTSPMVYILSHTWPDRWLSPGIKDSISVYSNCDEVELFNDVNAVSLGRKKNRGIGTHFQWDQVKIDYNVLYAVGYVNGKAVAKDYIVLSHLPAAPHYSDFDKGAVDLGPERAYHYLYRMNAGGPDYTDHRGNVWMADRQRDSRSHWGSTSWTADFPGIPAFFASQRRTFDPVRGTSDDKLFQDFRYGRDQLKFEFPVPDGEYRVELYFTEPWLGTGGGVDCTGWRLFDVAVNGKVVLKDLDIWKESGHDGALKKVVNVKVTGGQLAVSFPNVKAGQALISAIAIATKKTSVVPAPPSAAVADSLYIDGRTRRFTSWMDTGDQFAALPPSLFGAEWANADQGSKINFQVKADADVYIAAKTTAPADKTETAQHALPAGLTGYENTGTFLKNNKGQQFAVYKKRYQKGSRPDLQGINQPLTIAINPVSSLAPAFDLKTAVNYPAVATLPASKGVVKEALMGKDRIKFVENEGGVIEFNISVGVADTYSLTLKYHNPSGKEQMAQIEVLAMDGTIMKKPAVLKLAQTKAGKWSYITTDTGTMINAGQYKVRILSVDARETSIDALEVQ
ncbi:MAG: glycoside hydrolase N-terminal domain-containing protein [Pedobacter sp.]|uniref:glycosyl hydrolase family 95 catalytic domain-containing protein n=1 Tax=Pedobacter sp. TaxID=1411316 RepID=UPI0033994DE2